MFTKCINLILNYYPKVELRITDKSSRVTDKNMLYYSHLIILDKKSMRQKLLAANWKMNSMLHIASSNVDAYKPQGNTETVVFPHYLEMAAIAKLGVTIGAQAANSAVSGAFTGDVSMHMVKDAGCTYVLCGHSERRAYHHETHENIQKQVSAALELGLKPILCIGETAEQKTANSTLAVIQEQLQGMSITKDVCIAYEPVWAIGTGKTPTVSDIQEVHAYIRSLLPVELQSQVRILYGGSLKPDNAAAIVALPDVDGGLIGGASLDPVAFASIVKIASTI